MATRKRTWKELTTAIQRTFRLWNVRIYSIEPLDAPARRDRFHDPEQRKVIVRFMLPASFVLPANRKIVLVANVESVAHDNLEVLATALETMRLSNVRRTEHLLVAAYRQRYPVTPMPASQPMPQLDPTDPYVVLGVEPHYPLEVIETIWKARLRVEHPDAGGNGDKAQRLNLAMQEIRKRSNA